MRWDKMRWGNINVKEREDKISKVNDRRYGRKLEYYFTEFDRLWLDMEGHYIMLIYFIIFYFIILYYIILYYIILKIFISYHIISYHLVDWSIISYKITTSIQIYFLSQQSEGEYEMRLLESTLEKITSLLRVGFGEAGAGIIRANLNMQGEEKKRMCI